MPWFRYPPGYDNINVEGNAYGSDHKDRDGNQYFQAPDSAVPHILAVPGFSVVQRPPDVSPDIQDVTAAAVADPMAELSGQVETHRAQNQALTDRINELTKENGDLKEQVAALQNQVTQLSPPGPQAADVDPQSAATVAATGDSTASGEDATSSEESTSVDEGSSDASTSPEGNTGA